MKAAVLVLLPIAIIGCAGEPTPSAATSPSTPSVTQESPLPSALPSGVVLPFDPDTMTRPKRLGGQTPIYNRAAREAGAEGLVVAKCIITTSGAVTRCQILGSLPPLDQAVLDALSTWQMTPIMFNGKPVSVLYAIPFKFRLE